MVKVSTEAGPFSCGWAQSKASGRAGLAESGEPPAMTGRRLGKACSTVNDMSLQSDLPAKSSQAGTPRPQPRRMEPVTNCHSGLPPGCFQNDCPQVLQFSVAFVSDPYKAIVKNLDFSGLVAPLRVTHAVGGLRIGYDKRRTTLAGESVRLVIAECAVLYVLAVRAPGC